ncbi:MAG TPA: DM13 domain-containing protein [Anaerolineales bacterium]|nr:DM13 domain-containing protein [Anaerolineales bacterium]HRQ91842.1 DM13 domain-containing protein [Anaerolineales bacterium]
MFKKTEVRLAVLGFALVGSTLFWYLISPLFTSHEAYTFFPTLGVMASSTPRPATATPLPTLTPEARQPAGLVAVGDFVDVSYSGAGTVEVHALSSGAHMLSFEGFSVEPGPELHVLLSTAEAADTITEQDVQDSLDLGLLLATEGEQSYELPAGMELGEYTLILIWCEPQQTPYIAAMLQPVALEPTPDS